jgi:KDO2-lipid IV(A) lauroyltransferase
VYLALTFLQRFFSLLPERLAVGLAELLGRVWHAVDGGRRRIARSNIALAFPEWPWRRVCATARAAFMHFTRGTMVFFRRRLYLDPAYLERHVRIVGEGHMRAAVEQGRGVVVLLAHWGNWEIGGLVLNRLGLRHAAVGRAHRSKDVMRFLNESRARSGTRFIDKHEAVRPVLAALRAGELVGFFIDQTTRDRSTLTMFFGRPCKTPIGPAGFAVKTGAPVVPVMCPRMPDGRYEARFYAPIARPATGDARLDVGELTHRMTHFVEERVREQPGQWLWMHRRWKPPEDQRCHPDFRYVETILVAALDPRATAEAIGRVCALLRETYPHARLSVLVPRGLSLMLRPDGRLDEVIADEAGLRGGLRLVRRLRRRLFHVAVVLGGSIRPALLAWLAAIPLRVGPNDQPGRRLLTHRAPSGAADETLEEHWVRVAAILGARSAATEPAARAAGAVTSGAP